MDFKSVNSSGPVVCSGEIITGPFSHIILLRITNKMFVRLSTIRYEGRWGWSNKTTHLDFFK